MAAVVAGRIFARLFLTYLTYFDSVLLLNRTIIELQERPLTINYGQYTHKLSIGILTENDFITAANSAIGGGSRSRNIRRRMNSSSSSIIGIGRGGGVAL